jgi:UDP-glucose 4-epimerase
MDEQEKKEIIENKKILITGGTGSLGHQIVKILAKFNPSQIIIISRDENKHFNMQNFYSQFHFLKFELGDIRDYSRMKEIIKDVDIIIHAAALKHVHYSESQPMEFIKTNILGTKNIIDLAIENKIPVFVGIGTDKAVKPVNIYGMSKAIQEKLIIAASKNSIETRFINVRYGNVIGSRGSVIPFFKDKILKGETLPLTEPSMTRYLLRLEEAVELILYAIKNGKGGETFVKKMPAATIIDIAKAFGERLTGNKDYPTKVVGIRPGEKIHELLVSEDEMRRAIEFEDHYAIYDYGVLKEPRLINKDINEYGSYNTKRLNQEEILELLKKDGWI